MQFTPQELWAHTGTPVRVVIFTMFFMAIACVYVAVERAIALRRAGGQSRALAEAIASKMASSDAEGALSIVKQAEYSASYLGHMLSAGLEEFIGRRDLHGIEAATRALGRVSINEGSDLRKGLNILATTGSTAPFVGLVGTIFGIINCFSGMAESGSGGLGAVSAGIAEALVTTAIGIAVAIVGVWLFNFYTSWIEGITDDMAVASQELIDWCEKQVLPPFQEAAK